MPTNTFDREIKIEKEEDKRRLMKVMEEDSIEALSSHPYGEKERKRAEKLIKECIERSRRRS